MTNDCKNYINKYKCDLYCENPDNCLTCDRRDVDAILIDVAKKIWQICKESPEHGNAVMDLLGEETYNKIMKMQRIDGDITK